MEQNTSCEIEVQHCDKKKTDTFDLKVIEVEVLKDIKDSKEEKIEVCDKNPEDIESQQCDKKMKRSRSSSLSSTKSKKCVWPFTKTQAKAQIALVLVLLALFIIIITGCVQLGKGKTFKYALMEKSVISILMNCA